jgi:hypothetical protein
MVEVWIPVVTTLIGAGTTLLTIWYRNRLEKEKREKECFLSGVIEEESELLEKLSELRESVGASRASIYQFHNGGEYFTGKSMKKYSMTYEQVEKGIARIQHKNQSIPVSGAIRLFADLLENRTAFFEDLDREFPESLLKYNLQEVGINSIYCWSILDLNKNVIGVFTLDFILGTNKISQEDLDNIQLYVIKMAGYL